MASVFPTHVRLGALASAGSKHTTPASALLDLLDDAVEQRGGAGATNVELRAGVPVKHLKGDFVVLIDNGIGMQGLEEIEWSLLVQGKPELPKGDADAVAYFNTGHVSALAALAHEVIIATVRGGVGTLVRWGAPVTDAVHRYKARSEPDHKKTQMHAAMTFDMATGEPLEREGSERTEEELSASTLSAMCFGLPMPHLKRHTSFGFPMDDVTSAKLFSLFDPIRNIGHGTVIYFTAKMDGGVPLVGPTPDGASVQAGGKPLEEFLARSWMLPGNAAMPVEEDYGAPVRRNKLPFRVLLRGPHGATEVDFKAHPWTRVVADGHASPPVVLEVTVPGRAQPVRVHVQCGWLPNDDDAGIYLYRHKRLGAVLPQVYRMDTADAGALRHVIASNMRMPKVYKDMGEVYGGTSPISMAFISANTASSLQCVVGKNQVVLASCHDLTWLEGKEGFVQNALYEAVVLAVRIYAAQYARDTPWPAQYDALRRAEKYARMGRKQSEIKAAKRQAKAAAEAAEAAEADSEDGEEAAPPTPAPAPAAPQPQPQQQDWPSGRPRRALGEKRSLTLDPFAYGNEEDKGTGVAPKRAKRAPRAPRAPPAAQRLASERVQHAAAKKELASTKARLAACEALISGARAAHTSHKATLARSWDTMCHDVDQMAAFTQDYLRDMDAALAVPAHSSASQ